MRGTGTKHSSNQFTGSSPVSTCPNGPKLPSASAHFLLVGGRICRKRPKTWVLETGLFRLVGRRPSLLTISTSHPPTPWPTSSNDQGKKRRYGQPTSNLPITAILPHRLHGLLYPPRPSDPGTDTDWHLTLALAVTFPALALALSSLIPLQPSPGCIHAGAPPPSLTSNGTVWIVRARTKGETRNTPKTAHPPNTSLSCQLSMKASSD